MLMEEKLSAKEEEIARTKEQLEEAKVCFFSLFIYHRGKILTHLVGRGRDSM